MRKERPILFSTDMVRAILDGRKIATRRVIKPQPELTDGSGFKWKGELYGDGFSKYQTSKNFAYPENPYGKPGDLLYVRETWAELKECICYKATVTIAQEQYIGKWKPSIHMPKNASRVWLQVTDVWVEKLQEITTDDIKKEGAVYPKAEPWEAIDAWVELWDSINADRGFSWKSNPWVWVVEFDVISTNGKPKEIS